MNEKKIEIPFVDVTEKHWAYDAIVKAYELGLVKGNEKSELTPNNNVTKAEVIQMLINLYKKITNEEA